MKIIPLAKQVIVKKLPLPKATNKFIEVDTTLLGEFCEIVSMGPDCRSDYKPGDRVIVLGGQIFAVPQLDVQWVHDDAILMKVEGYEDGR